MSAVDRWLLWLKREKLSLHGEAQPRSFWHVGINVRGRVTAMSLQPMLETEGGSK